MKTSLTRLVAFFVHSRDFLRRAWLAIACGFVAAVSAPAVHAAGPPEAMAYQGFLVDANGNPLASTAPANYPVIFRIFAAPTGGASLWSEQQIVTVDKGNFSVILSEGTSIGEPRPLLSTVLATNGADRYIELSVVIGNPPAQPMLPRLRLLPMAYSFLATSANNLVNPSGVAVVRYANNRVEVTGDLSFSGGVSGNGSGLTGLTAGQVGSGIFADARLSANVALRNVGNTFSGNQTINGAVGIGGPPVGALLDVEGDARLNLHDLFFREGGDVNHGLGWYGPAKPFGGVALDGPILYGFLGGGLGIRNGGDKVALRWDSIGNVGIGTSLPGARLSLVANGAAELQGSALSTTLRTTAGNLGTTAGNELALTSIGFNSGNNSSLGIRAVRTANGADWTSTAIGLGMDVDNSVRVNAAAVFINANGNVGINTATPTARLEVNGNLKAATATVTGDLNMGNAGQFKAAVGGESLRIVRGTVRINGTGVVDPNRQPVVLSGANFTVRKVTTNPIGAINGGGYNFDAVCEVIFNPPFADPPTITVCPLGDKGSGGGFNWWNNARVESTSTTNAIISSWHPANGGWVVLAPFSFIAVGTR